MHLQAALALLTLSAAANASTSHRRAADKFKRQAPPAAPASVAPASVVPAPVSAPAPATPVAPPPSTVTPAVAGIPHLESITMGMPPGTTDAVQQTFAPGATPTISGAPALPTFVFKLADWPKPDTAPDTTSPQVQEWMKELDGYDIPSFKPTVDGSCVNDTAAAADAQNRGWWTCGGWTRPVDITSCPDKFTWGLSFDDGPSDYTTKLIDHLNSKKLQATFFVVGSRVVERPTVVVEEYMTGHEISVHTWSHPHLTALSNEAIVAELGWTRAAIKAVIGVTPTTFRPPYGDIDDRVRAIALAMGLVPIIWTRNEAAGPFDTNDWQVAGGLMTGVQQYETFQSILGNASTLNTGFIVLEHDLFEITVDLAMGYTLNAALTYNPPLTLKPIGQCMKIPTTNLYVESNTNKTFPAPAPPAGSGSGGKSGSGSNSANAKTGNSSSSSSNGASASFGVSAASALLAAVVAAGVAVL